MKTLAELNGRRCRFQGTFERFGKKQSFGAWPTKTVLLVDVCDMNGELICDHYWFTVTNGFKQLKLSPGDYVAFDGRVTEHRKGYRGFREQFNEPRFEYKISFPTNFSKNKSPALSDLPLFAQQGANKQHTQRR